MKTIEIELYDKEKFLGMVELNSKDLGITYVSMPCQHGLQSNYDGDDDRYVEQMQICSEIVKLVKRLDEIS